MRLLFAFFFISFFSFSQIKSSSVIVEYTHSIKLEVAPSTTTINSTLVSNNFNSLYEMDFVGDTNFISEDDGEEGAVLYIKPTKNPKIYKNLKERTIYSKERIAMRSYLVIDSINIFKWDLNNNHRTILGYKCQEAKLSFRGREYIAFFTLEVPFAVGPWKFDGLPGLILQIESIDGAFKINASKLEIKNVNVDISNPFENQKSISWDEFILHYKQKYEELLHYRSPDGGRMLIPKKNIEEFIKD